MNAAQAACLFHLSKIEILKMVKHALTRQWYVIVEENTKVDELFAKPYQNMGIKFKLGLRLILPTDVFVVGNYVCHNVWEPQHKGWIKTEK